MDILDTENLIDNLLEFLYTRLSCLPDSMKISRLIFKGLLREMDKRAYNRNDIYIEFIEKKPVFKFHGLKIVADGSIPEGVVRFLFPEGQEHKDFRLVNVGK